MRNRKKKNIKKVMILIVIAVVSIKVFLSAAAYCRDTAGDVIADFLQDKAEHAYLMPVSYMKSDSKIILNSGMSERVVRELLPLYAYADEEEEHTLSEDEFLEEFYRQKEGSDEDRKGIDEEQLDYDKNALHIENSMLAEMERENRAFAERQNTQEEQAEHIRENENREDMVQEQLQKEAGFTVAQYPAYTYDWEEQWGYEELISNFYAIDASTDLKEEYLNLDKLL